MMNIERLRQLRDKFNSQHEYHSASYWADKIVSLSDSQAEDVYQQAHCHFQCKEFHRAAHCIKSRNLHKHNLACKHLAAKCHFSANEFKDALDILGGDTNDDSKANSMEVTESNVTQEERNWKSAISLLKGYIYEATDNRSIAANCFKEALRWNVFCHEAFFALTQHQMLSRQEEEELINSLAFKKQCQPGEANFVKFLYETQLKKYDKPGDLVIPAEYAQALNNNVDLMTSKAERHYYNCEYQQCFKITTQVLSKDIFHSQCLPIHISCMMELKKTNQLFELAHKLVDLYPESSLAWFAVGCYYLLISKTDAARRYLSKATTLDNVFAPAWLLYGHSFAVESEHDQAMAAYFKASHLMRGCHLPLLYIGLEYGLTDNTKLAERFFSQALSIAPSDPFVLHELGVIAYQSLDFTSAENHFKNALNIIKTSKEITVLPDKWEPLFNNMGHVLRKLKRYEEALDFHKQALILSPQNASTYSSIGFVYSLMTKWNEAVEYFHKALGLKRDDAFSTSMLGHAIDHLVNEITPFSEMSTSSIVPYEKQTEIDKFKSVKASEDKNLILPSGKSSSKSKMTTLTVGSSVLESSTDDVEMEISN